MVSLDRCNRNCNNIDDPFGRICIPNKENNVNLNVFNIITDINNCRCKFDSSKCNLNQKRNKDKCQCDCKKLIHCVCKEDYAWNSSTCACECNKQFYIDNYLKSYTCVKSIIDSLVMKRDEI